VSWGTLLWVVLALLAVAIMAGLVLAWFALHRDDG